MRINDKVSEFGIKLIYTKTSIHHAPSYDNRYKWPILHHGGPSVRSQIEYRARIRPGTQCRRDKYPN